MSRAMVQLRKALKTDELWKRFRLIEKGANKPEFEAFIDELKRLHSTRSVRVLGAQSAPSGRKVADAAMRDQSVRSRCVEISMEITHSRNYLSIAMLTVKSHINATYGGVLLDAGIRSITERRSMVESLFGKAERTLDSLDTITEIADMVIKDVDQASFSIKHTVEALSVATAREKSY